MAKSIELYTLCDVCDGMGVAVDSELNSPIDRKCLVCGGRRYLPLGLNKSQVDAALRKAGEYDKFMADFANDGSKPRPAKITDVPLSYVQRAIQRSKELENRINESGRATYDESENDDGA